MSNVNTEFEGVLGQLVGQGFTRADSGLLREVAERLWYSHSVPDLTKVPSRLRADAGYLVDRLARFNVLSKEQKLLVMTALSPFKPIQPVASACKDPLAVTWGASMDLTTRLPELMPYQTRQYASDRASHSARM